MPARTAFRTLFSFLTASAVGSGVLLLAAAAGAAQAGEISQRIRAASGYIPNAETERVIAQLPVPPRSVADGRACSPTALQFTDDAAKTDAGWTLPGYGVQLKLWAIYHFGERAGTGRGNLCGDGDFVARAWQAALGEPVTGVLTAQQGARFVQVVDANAPSFGSTKAQPPGAAPVDQAASLAVPAAAVPPPLRLTDVTRSELVAALPPPTSRQTFVTQCTRPDFPFESAASARLGAAQRTAHPMVDVLGAWALRYFRFNGVPVGCVDTRFVVQRWQEAMGHRPTGVLTTADVDRFVTERDEAVARVSERRQAEAAAAVERRQAEALAAEERRKADEVAAAKEKQRQEAAERERVRLAQERERTLRPLLAKSADPQAVYLQAGRFERLSDYDAARQLYTHLVDNFSKAPWAVKANDRLLALRAEEKTRQREREAAEARTSATAADRTRRQAAAQDDAMRARARMQQDMFDDMDRINEENRRRMEEDRRRLDEQQRAEREAIERANEIRRRQQEEWEAEERRRRGG